MKKLWKKVFESRKNDRVMLTAMLSSIILAIIITGLGMGYYKYKINEIDLVNNQSYEDYEYHYALITGNDDDFFWNSVYEGAKEKGRQLNVYVENFGKNLNFPYSINELIEMAIAAKVDGIIVKAEGDERTQELINCAVEIEIPVVTVLEDASYSNRQCFVGVNNYNLGKEYGTQVLNASNENTRKVMVLIDSSIRDTSHNIILSGIRETLEDTEIEVTPAAIDRESTFSSEEAIRDIVMDMENSPDIIICLNSVDTVCAYQAVVDFNKVGEINIIGYYNSETVLTAIQKNIIYSTIVIDTNQMGAYSVEALNEYKTSSRVSNYISVDTNLISAKDVKRYLSDEIEKPE